MSYGYDARRRTFTGKERDQETALDYFGARYDSSAQGRFMSPDTGAAKPEDPQTWNRYAYVTNNPGRYVDPNGRQRMEIYQNQVIQDYFAGRITREQLQQRLTGYAPPSVGFAGAALMTGGTAAEMGLGASLLSVPALYNWATGFFNSKTGQEAVQVTAEMVMGCPTIWRMAHRTFREHSKRPISD